MRLEGQHVFVTGATGFIGGAVARRLLAHGARVTCLVRPKTNAAQLEHAGATIVRGNVTEPQTLDLSGQDSVVHAAAWVGFGIPERHVELFRRTNVEGTRNVLHAAERAGIKKFVQVSSVAALGEKSADETPLTEEAARPRERYRSEYERTKTESHLTVVAGSITNALPMPGLVMGPAGPFDWLVRALARNQLPALPSDDTDKGWVHIEDTADGIVQCLAKGTGPYILVDENMRLTDLLVAGLEEAGLPVPRRRVSTSLLMAGAGAVEGFYALRRKTPPVSRELVGKLRVPMRYDSSRARKELGWRPELIQRLADDMRAHAKRG